MTDDTILALVLILSAPTFLVLLLALLRGYSIRIWRRDRRDPK